MVLERHQLLLAQGHARVHLLQLRDLGRQRGEEAVERGAVRRREVLGDEAAGGRAAPVGVEAELVGLGDLGAEFLVL